MGLLVHWDGWNGGTVGTDDISDVGIVETTSGIAETVRLWERWCYWDDATVGTVELLGRYDSLDGELVWPDSRMVRTVI